MKYFVFSDLHGSKRGMDQIENAIYMEEPDCLLLLGDILHGGYDGGDEYCAKWLSSYKGGILAVRGNCDFAEDAYALGFELPLNRHIDIEMHRIHLSHKPYAASYPPGDVVLNGHTHCKSLYSDGGVIHLNPGSCAYPRDSGPSYAIIEGRTITLKNLEDGSVIQELTF